MNYEKKTGLINNENKALEREEGFHGSSSEWLIRTRKRRK